MSETVYTGESPYSKDFGKLFPYVNCVFTIEFSRFVSEALLNVGCFVYVLCPAGL